MRHRIVIALAAILLSPPAWAAEDGSAAVCSKNGATADAGDLDVARGILKTTHATDNVVTAIDAMMPPMMDLIHRAAPQIPDNAMADLKNALHDEMIKQLPDLMNAEACIYVQHFSHDELQQLAAFYAGPLGSKLLSENPAILKENIAIGQAWGQRAATTAVQHIIAKYRKDGNKT
ncbi:MAG: DUF2059 domain-containing protein [Rhizomicrobium sp.]